MTPRALRPIVREGSLTPGAAQAMLLGAVVIDVVVHAFSGFGEGTVRLLYVAGLCVAGLATILLPVLRRREHLLIALPLLDLLAIGLLRVDGDTGVELAMTIPAIWLGTRFFRRGVLWGTAVGAVSALLPPLLVGAVTGHEWARHVQLALLVLIVSLALSVTAALWRHTTERAQLAQSSAEEALERLRKQQRVEAAILGAVDAGIVMVHEDGRYASMNPRHVSFMELAFPEGHAGYAGQMGHVYAADGHTPLTQPEMPSLRASRGEELDAMLIWVGPDPRRRTALMVSARQLVDEHGVRRGAVLSYHDVTDLFAALRAKDEFVSSVSHELRTPLTSIVGYVDLIVDDERLPPDVRGHLRRVQRNGDRLHRMVADLLQTAHQETMQLGSMQSLDLAEVGRAVQRGMRRQALQAEVSLEHDLRATPVRGDLGRLEQVVENLVSNAIKYSEPGGRVELRSRTEDQESVLEVSDVGIGMTAEEVEQAFTRFFRSQVARDRAIPGVGLGLSICQDIARAHGGRVSVSSAPDRGTTVQLRLPRRAEPAPRC